MENVSFVVGYLLFAGAGLVNAIQALASRQPGLLPGGRAAWGYKAFSWTMLTLSIFVLVLAYQTHCLERPNAGAFVLFAAVWVLLTGASTRVRNQLLARLRNRAVLETPGT